MSEAQPLVSVVIPARNEAENLIWALRSLTDQTYPADRIEVIVVDGGSADDTAHIAKEYLSGKGFHRVEVLVNPTGTTPSSLNIGLASALGVYVCRVDARSRIPRDYIATCCETLGAFPGVGATGGAQVAQAANTDAIVLGIARALNNPYGMGGARYRRNTSSGKTDTIYLGFFRTHQLQSVEGWNEAFLTNQDFELNQRINAEVGDLWFDDSIPVDYRPRTSIATLFAQYRRFGSWKMHYWRSTGHKPRPRQWVLLAIPPSALAGIVAFALRFRSDRNVLMVGSLGWLAAVIAVERSSTGPVPATLKSRIAQLVALAAIASGWELGVLETAIGLRQVDSDRPGR
ncbi:MAG: glycosyltransferase [Acidimicrobiales bacterium]